MLYNASHITRHRYATPVVSSLSEVRLTPRSSAGQRVLESAIRVHPEPVHWQRRTEYFGNVVTSCDILESHDCLIVEAGSLVEVEPAAMVPCDISWEAARGRVAAPDGADEPAAPAPEPPRWQPPTQAAAPPISSARREKSRAKPFTKRTLIDLPRPPPGPAV